MKLRNPWIDPRVAHVRSASLSGYLRRHGWEPLDGGQSVLAPFAPAGDADDAPVVSVPLMEQGRDYAQRVIECITAIAQFENRYAVHVLDDILREPAPSAPPSSETQGSPHSVSALG